MGRTSMRTLLDNLGTVSESERQRLRAGSDAATSAAADNGLTFARGDRVVDLATGGAGVVREAQRALSRGVEIFAVELADGRLVHRGPGELARDVPATVAPAK